MPRGKTVTRLDKSSSKKRNALPTRDSAMLQEGKRVLEIEARAVQVLIDRLDERFVQAVDVLYQCKGKVIVSGMGKSGLIGQKIAATLASTGTPSFFLHPAEESMGIWVWSPDGMR